MLTIITFDPMTPYISGYEVILYLMKAPPIAPILRKKISINSLIKLKT